MQTDCLVLGDFLNFCPIFSIDGSQMKPYDVNKMMGQLKKAQIEKVVQFDKMLFLRIICFIRWHQPSGHAGR